MNMQIEMTPEQIAHSVAVETRNWEAKRVIPGLAADTRRQWARMFPAMAPLHNAVADEWERIMAAPEHREAICRVIRRELNEALIAMANTHGTEFHEVHMDKAAKLDRMLIDLDPNHER